MAGTRVVVELIGDAKALFTDDNQLLDLLRSHSSPDIYHYIANASNVHGYDQNLKHMKANKQSCVFSALVNFATAAKTVLDPLTLPDALTNIPPGENYRRIINKVTLGHTATVEEAYELATLYLFAHRYADHHPDAQITLNFYLRNTAQLQTLQRQLKQFHVSMPANVTIILQHCEAAIRELYRVTGTGKFHVQYYQSTSALHAQTAQTPDEVRPVFASEAPVPPAPKTLAVFQDADKCLYNDAYFCIYSMLILEFHERIDAAKTAATETITQLVKDMDAFLNTIESSKLTWGMRVTLMVKLGTMIDTRPWRRDIREFAAKQCAVGHGAHLFKEFIDTIMSLSQPMHSKILFLANGGWLADIQMRARDNNCAAVSFFCGSLRQNTLTDNYNAYINGTGNFIVDFPLLVEWMQARHGTDTLKFTLQGALMSDWYNHCVPGHSYHLAATKQPKSGWLQWGYDSHKITLTYCFIHYLRHNHPECEHVIFYDDSEAIHNKHAEVFRQNDPLQLLPKGMTLTMAYYAGGLPAVITKITGAGQTDMNLHTSIELLLQQCGVRLLSLQSTLESICIEKRYDLKAFADFRFTQLPPELARFEKAIQPRTLVKIEDRPASLFAEIPQVPELKVGTSLSTEPSFTK